MERRPQVNERQGPSMSGVEILDSKSCYDLLRSTDIGRFAVISGRYPIVFPVNFALDGEVITFRTGQGAKLRAALHGDISFEADGVSADRSTAWSVLVFGTVDHNGIALNMLERREHLGIHPMDPSEKPAWIRINAANITGRRFTRQPSNDTPAFEACAYL
jgi:hypothetical protein